MPIFRLLGLNRTWRRGKSILRVGRLARLNLVDDLGGFLLDYSVFGVELGEEIVHELGILCCIWWRRRGGRGRKGGQNFLELIAF